MGSKWGKNKTCSFSAQLILIESLRSSFQNFIFQIGYDISKLNVFMNYHFWLRWTVLRAHFKFSYLMLVMIYQDRSFLCTINAHVNLNLRGLVFFNWEVYVKQRNIISCRMLAYHDYFLYWRYLSQNVNIAFGQVIHRLS